MFGDSFFTGRFGNEYEVIFTVFVPMFGDSFFTFVDTNFPTKAGNTFSSPCLGILFSPYYGKSEKRIYGEVFVPMLGDSFFT